MKKVFLATLGCKVNQFESAAFKTGFEEEGMSIISSSKEADLIVINTCAVTAAAGAQSRQTIRQALRNNPSAQIIITGCYAEIAAQELSDLKELQGRPYSLIGNSKKDQLVAAGLANEPVTQKICCWGLSARSEKSAGCRSDALVNVAGPISGSRTAAKVFAPTASSPTPEAPAGACRLRK